MKRLLSSTTVVASIIGGIFLILSSLLQQNNGKLNIVNISGDSIGRDKITINKTPTYAEEIKSKEDLEIIDNDKMKIRGFLRYRNNENYFEANNNIYFKISHIYSQEKLKEFRSQMDDNDIFIINDINILGNAIQNKVTNFTASKYLVKLEYGYDNHHFQDEVIFSVRRDLSDKKQHHIEYISCAEKSNSPLCNFINN